MIDLDELVALHGHDLSDKFVFAAYSAAVPIYRLAANLLVTEAVDLDPIELFLLEGITAGLQRPSSLSGFFGLEQDLVDSSIGFMLHNQWVSAAAGAGEIQLSLLPAGLDVLQTQRGQVETAREAELWVDGLLGRCEVRPLRGRTLRLTDVRNQHLHRWAARIPQPHRSSDLDFDELARSVLQFGPQLWPGVQLASLLDLLNVSPRGTGYRRVEVLVFQGEAAADVEFQVYERGERAGAYENVLRRLESEQDKNLVPTDRMPPAQDLAAFEKEYERIALLQPSGASVAGPEQSDYGRPPTVGPDPIDTRDRLRREIADKEFVIAEQVNIIEGQKLLRNHENRIAWKRVLSEEATSFVIMEFPWITAEAIDAEMLDCFANAIRRGVRLWLAWGLQERGKAGGRAGDPDVLRDLESVRKKYGNESLTVIYRGDTHRKVLVWDDKAAIVGSFNWGSFRGDPKYRVRQEISVQIRSPREVESLVAEYKRLFKTDRFANSGVVQAKTNDPGGIALGPRDKDGRDAAVLGEPVDATRVSLSIDPRTLVVGSLVTARGARVVQEGVIVTLGGHEGLVPTDELFNVRANDSPARRQEKLSQTVGQPLSLKVIRADERFGVIFSERTALQDRNLSEAIAAAEPPKAETANGHQRTSTAEMIAGGENSVCEFKASARWNLEKQQKDKAIEGAVLKTVAGFLNALGGTLLIGVNDRGEAVGLQEDLKTNHRADHDGYESWITDLFDNAIGKPALAYIAINFEDVAGKDVCRLDVTPSPAPVYVDAKPDAFFYVRMNNSTRKLNARDCVEYVKQHWQLG